MIRGTLIGESLAVGSTLKLTSQIRLVRIARIEAPPGEAPGQPSQWTVIDFEADDSADNDLAAALASVIQAEGGWYADFRVGDEHVVVFSEKIFRYRRGDQEAREKVHTYGRSVGVPDAQLDWKD